MVALNVAKKNNIKISECKTKLTAVDGSPLDVSGICELRIDTIPDGRSTTINAIVSSSISNDVILGYEDLKTIGSINENFPHPEYGKIAKVNELNELDIYDRLKTKLIHKYPQVIRDELPEATQGNVMKITLTENAKPYIAMVARKTPLNLQKQADKLIKELLKAQIIARVTGPTDWCAPGTFLAKQSGGVRLVADYKELNKYLVRPVHPFPSAFECIKGISPESNIFATMDACSGYHHIPLDEPSSLLTTFIIPQGCFRFLCAPMGLSSSGDEWCHRSDETIENIENVRKLVDDYFVEAKDIKGLEKTLCELLDNCAKAGVTFSKCKFQIGESVKFAGHIVSKKGVEPDPDKLEAIRNFPSPINMTSLCSFLGMINQLAQFIPNLATYITSFHDLMKKKNAFVWLHEHEEAFRKIKEELTSKLMLQHFDPHLPSYLICDASKLHGIGYVLVQSSIGPSNPERVIQCGSRGLTDAEKNYAVIELEATAIAWSLKKTSYFITGLPNPYHYH